MVQKSKPMPKSWSYVEVRQLKVVGFTKDKGGNKIKTLEEAEIIKHISMPISQLDVLNEQQGNTLVRYKPVDEIPEVLTPEQQIEADIVTEEVRLDKLAEEKAQLRKELKAEILAELKKAEKK